MRKPIYQGAREEQREGEQERSVRSGQSGVQGDTTARKGVGTPLQVDMTPGRAPAEGPDMDMASPSHERWEQDTYDRAPAEGPDMTMPVQEQERAGRK